LDSPLLSIKFNLVRSDYAYLLVHVVLPRLQKWKVYSSNWSSREH